MRFITIVEVMRWTPGIGCRWRGLQPGEGFHPGDRGIIDARRVQLAAPGGRHPGCAAVPAAAGALAPHRPDGRWTAFRAEDTAGIAAGAWLLIFGELLCWGAFGVYESDPRLMVPGATGVTASLLVLARVAKPRGPRPLQLSDRGAPTTAEVRG